MGTELLIRESADLSILESSDADGDGIFNADGTVDMVLIRPCNGRGYGNKIFEADMLAANAGVFKGWSMFDNHDSPAAKRARQGLPRAPSELAGVVRESHWDPDYTTDEDEALGFDQGAVVGKCALTDVMEALVRRIPEAIKGSLNAQATNVTEGERRGRKGWIVEAFVDDSENSSFDLVTKAGAGGRVRSILESLADEHDASEDLSILESLEDSTITAWLTEHRPTILESPGGNDMGMTIQEALQTDEVKGYIATLVQEGVAEQATTMRDEIRAEVQDELGQTEKLRSLAAKAHTLISEAPLPAPAKALLFADYALVEDDATDEVTPGRGLAVIEAEYDADGAVTKTAKAVLTDAIKSEADRLRSVIRETSLTVPTARGAVHGTVLESAGRSAAGDAALTAIRNAGLDPKLFGMADPTAKSE